MKDTVKSRIDDLKNEVRIRIHKIEMDLEWAIHTLETQITHEREVAKASLVELHRQHEALLFISPTPKPTKPKPAPKPKPEKEKTTPKKGTPK